MNKPNSSQHDNHRTSSTPSRPTPLHRRLSFWIIVLFVVLAIAFFRYKSLSTVHKEQGQQKAPIVVASVRLADMPVYLSALGTVTPTYSVTVRTQINGTLMSVLFHEGQLVKKGDLLAEIDDRPYLAQLTQYEGQIARDRAQLANAKIDLKRYQRLWKQDSVAQQTLATQAALVMQLEGTIKLDEGLLQATKVNLIYTKITSPIDGRIGLRLVDPGNFIQTSDVNGIAVVNMLNPITIVFPIPEDNIPEVMQRTIAGDKLLVEAYDRQQNKLLAKGNLLTVDNQIDTTTGTVKLKAEFANEHNILFPSQFVNISLLVKTLHNVTVVPTAAIQNSVQGTFVYVLNPQAMTVKVTPVSVGVTTKDTTEIKSGLSVGQVVVTAGTDRLFDGSTVSLPSASKPKPKELPGKQGQPGQLGSSHK
jgi:multidrug efflux system membrane fusion protein